MLKARGISIRIEDRVLAAPFSFHVKPGDVIALMGVSGSGKSSLIRTLTRERELGDGELDLESNWAEIPQNESLNPLLSALDNAEAGLLKNLGFWNAFARRREGRSRLRQLLSDWGLRNPDQPVSSLSGGEKQRLCIVRALAMDWKILYADEPISQLDEANARKALKALREEAVRRQGAIIWALHQPDLAREFSDRILTFDGRGGVSES